MKKIIQGLLLWVLLLSPAYVSAQDNSVFVLVDVSGTMKVPSVNTEAKEQIKSIINGTYKMSDWQSKNWQITQPSNLLSSNSKIIKDGQIFCLLPFGNEKTVYNNRQKVKISGSNWENTYNTYFPTKYNEENTCIDLAKAYVGSIAQSSKIRSAYVFVYTDAVLDNSSQVFDNYSLDLVKKYNAAQNNALQLVAELKKVANSRAYYIQIYKFSPFSTLDDKHHDGVLADTSKGNGGNEDEGKGGGTTTIRAITINSPKDGKSEHSPCEISKDEKFKITWSNAKKPLVTVTYAGGKGKIDNKGNKVYLKEERGNSATITFFESGLYKVKVSENGKSDERYINVKASFPIMIILIIIAIILVVLVISKLSGKPTPPKPGGWDVNPHNPKNGQKQRNRESEDW